MRSVVRGLRGAITVEENSEGSIRSRVRELLERLIELNDVETEDIVSIIFTSTPDLNAAFPASALRGMGFDDVPLLGCSEIAVPGAIEKCIRILIHINTEKSQKDIVHAYLGRAKALRQDRAK